MVIALTALGLVITLLTGRRRLRLNEEHGFLTTAKTDMDITIEGSNPQREHRPGKPSSVGVSESGSSRRRSFVEGGVHVDQTSSLLPGDQTASSEYTPLLGEHTESSGDSAEFVGSHGTSIPTSYGADESIGKCREQPPDTTTFSEDAQAEESLINDVVKDDAARRCKPCPCGQSFKAKIVFISISTYLSTGTVIMYTLTTSDFVAKAIYGGDPEAAPGSESLARSVWMIISFFFFLVFNVCTHCGIIRQI